MAEIILEMRGITKVFPGTKALDEMNFDLRKGEVHAIVGENGAGKSTLMKILSGVYSKTSGQIFFNGSEVEINSSSDAQTLGISMIYQELANLPKLSVAENIFLGRLPRRRLFGVVDFNKLYEDSMELFARYEVDIDPKKRMEKLSVAEKQFVEILKAISVVNTKIVIMDEPTSSLTKREIELLFAMIKKLKKEGISIIYISHRLDEIVEIADRVSAFRDGKNRGTMAKGEFDQKKIIDLMLGHSLQQINKENVARKDVIFSVRNLKIKNRVENFELSLHKGEILGIAGLMGSGKDELVKSLFGLWPAISKEVYFKGQKIVITQTKDALKHGIVYLPEERRTQALFLPLSVESNITPIWLLMGGKTIIDRKKEKTTAERLKELLSIKTSSLQEPIRGLSGGNQQKAVISRLLAVDPEVLIMNDPTRGVDVGSKEEIYGLIRDLAKKGTSIIIVSSELQELTYLANRVLVLQKGDTVGEFDGDFTLKDILTCAVGAKI